MEDKEIEKKSKVIGTFIGMSLGYAIWYLFISLCMWSLLSLSFDPVPFDFKQIISLVLIFKLLLINGATKNDS